MKNKNVLSFIGLGLAVISTALFIFLYVYPYNTIPYTHYTHKDKSIDDLGITSEKLNVVGDFEKYSSSISAYDLTTVEESSIFYTNANIKASEKYDEDFFNTNSLVVIGVKGSIVNYSKITKMKTKDTNVNVTIGVENDHIVTGVAHPDDDIYAYYIIDIKNNKTIDTLNISFAEI